MPSSSGRSQNPKRLTNLLLDSLPPVERTPLLDRGDVVSLDLEDVLYEPGESIDHVHFPLSCVVSLLTTLSAGLNIETATVGREGMVGLDLFLGADRSPNVRAIVQMPGAALRIATSDFREAMHEAKLSHVLRVYSRSLLLQATQAVACNQAHTATQRLARWLLQTSDRTGKEEIPLTQQFLSEVIGVRRASISEAVSELRVRGGVTSRRGGIRIVDRALLEDAACECYGLIRRVNSV
jgi:CRP-like cAMP-binding protein